MKDSSAIADIVPARGERALLVGQTGSGKSQLALWILERMENSPIILYDTKSEKLLETLPRSRVVTSHAGVHQSVNDPTIDYIIFRIAPAVRADSDALDALLFYHYQNFRGVDAYIDELFAFSHNGRAGAGLLSLLTEGRSLGITLLMGVQKPRYMSSFTISETQKYYVFFLADENDKKRIAEFIPGFRDLPAPPEFAFYYYRIRQPSARLAGPISPDPIDKTKEKNDKPPDKQEPDRPDAGTSLNWL